MFGIVVLMKYIIRLLQNFIKQYIENKYQDIFLTV